MAEMASVNLDASITIIFVISIPSKVTYLCHGRWGWQRLALVCSSAC